METTANDGKSYKTNYYNLDAIISVGYRVNSSKATKFRIWATSTLKNYLTKGYVINEDKLKLEKDKVKTLQNTINLLSRSLTNQVENMEEAKNVAYLLNNFACGLDLLDNFDHKTLDTKGKTRREAVVIEEKHNEWTYEVSMLMDKIQEHTNASMDYMKLGGTLLELLENLYSQYIQQNNEEKRKLLKIVYSNFSFKGGGGY